jgi:redox-sensitive bicupin YhaK (pirin superfamily)
MWGHIDSPANLPQLHQDCNVVVSENDAQQEHSIVLAPGRQAYLLCIEGSVSANDTALAMRDAAELRAPNQPLPVTLRAGEDGAHFMLIEMAA